MLARYFKEKGAEVIETEGGFLAYVVSGSQFYISEFFIDEGYRQSSKHFLSLMIKAYDAAVAARCEVFSCHVPLSLPDANEILLSRLKFGYKVTTFEDGKFGMMLSLKECPWVRP